MKGQLTMNPPSSDWNSSIAAFSSRLLSCGPPTPVDPILAMISAALRPASESMPSSTSSAPSESGFFTIEPPADSIIALTHTVSDSA